MKRIAILRCLQSNDVCTGAACLSAFFQQKDSFTAYQGEEINLTAFFSCNGCGKIALKNDEGMQEKLDHLVQMHTDVVHIGICCFHKDKGGEVLPVPDHSHPCWGAGNSSYIRCVGNTLLMQWTFVRFNL